LLDTIIIPRLKELKISTHNFHIEGGKKEETEKEPKVEAVNKPIAKKVAVKKARKTRVSKTPKIKIPKISNI
jgi:hypothetical protein